MLLRRLARPLLAGMFIQGGLSALRDPKGHAELAAPVLDRAAPVLDRVTETTPLRQPPSNLTLVQIDAGVKIGAGVLLAFGKAPRLSAAALAASLIPTTLAAHRFWEMHDPTERADNELHFVKNLGLLGGLMLAAADTHGKPSLAWRARHAGETTAVTAGVGQLAGRAGRAGGQVVDVAGKAGSQASGAATLAGKRLTEQTEWLRSEADTLSTRTLKRAEKASKKARRTAKKLDEASKRASTQIDRASQRASKRADLVSKRVSKETSRQLKRANDRARRARSTVESKLS